MLPTKSTQTHAPSNNPPVSKVLLVCVYDTIALDITNDIIYQKFQQYGHIIKLLIFEKS